MGHVGNIILRMLYTDMPTLLRPTSYHFILWQYLGET